MATRKPKARAVKPAAKKKVASKKVVKAAARKAAPATANEIKDRRKPETLRIRSIAPGITADDLARSMHFYTDVLGFLVTERWMDANGNLRGVMLKAGACEIGLSQDDWAKGRNRKKGIGMRLWCETGQDIDDLARRIKVAGGALADGPSTQAWGAMSLSVMDPDGIHLTIFRES